MDSLIEMGSTEELLKANQQVRDKVRGDFLKYSEIYATYQKACNTLQEPLLKHNALKAMTTAVTKMADVLGSQKTASHGLEKLSVPTWDGNRKSYATWKSEFNYWMYKYKKDEDKQLQRLRKAGMENSWYWIWRSKEINGHTAKRNYQSQTNEEWLETRSRVTLLEC